MSLFVLNMETRVYYQITGCIKSNSQMAGHVRFGSKADIATSPTNVRFTPKSGHWNSTA
jgi:hypothetical protein